MLAVTTSGRAVIFAGIVVAVAFLGLFLMGLPFVAALGTAGAIVVVVAVLVAVTLMPAAMSLVGHRIDAWQRAVPAHDGRRRRNQHVVPLERGDPAQAAAVLLHGGGGAAALRRAGAEDAPRASPTTATTRRSTHSRRAYDLLTKGFGPGFNGPLILAVDMSGGGARQPR